MIQDKFGRAENYFNSMIHSENPITRFYGKLWLFCLRISQGRYYDCKLSILDAIKEAEKDHKQSDKVAFLNQLAYVYLKMNHLEEALEVLEQSEIIAKELNFHHDRILALSLRGVVQLQMNNAEEAEKTAIYLKNYLESLKIPKYMRYYYHLEGMIALYKNRDSEALEKFTKATSVLSFQHEALDDHAFYLYSLAMAYNKTNEQEKASEQFEKITELTSGCIQLGDIYARSYYWLGKIYQKRGEPQKAIENYQKFLELWKDADPEILESKQAKMELTILQ